MLEELLSFEDFIEKYKYENAFSLISYELYLIIKKLEELTENENTKI